VKDVSHLAFMVVKVKLHVYLTKHCHEDVSLA